MKNIDTINIHIVHEADLVDHHLVADVIVSFTDKSSISFKHMSDTFQLDDYHRNAQQQYVEENALPWLLLSMARRIRSMLDNPKTVSSS